jgi:hypothetical protein
MRKLRRTIPQRGSPREFYEEWEGSEEYGRRGKQEFTWKSPSDENKGCGGCSAYVIEETHVAD